MFPALRRVTALSLLGLTAMGAQAALLHDQNVTNNVITGSGITNGGFTVETAGGVEVGLRARERYTNPTPGGVYSASNDTNSNGDGTFNHAAGGFTPGPGGTGTAGGTRAAWNFDWSINTGTAPVSNFTYRLGIDYDAGFGTNYLIFDPINGINPNPAAGGLAVWDHSFGNNGTAQGAGVEASGANLAALLADYNSLKSSNVLVQNSWNLDFFDGGAFTFDPTANGNYSVFLEVISAAGVVARSDITVIVGTGAAVPEPGVLALAGLGLAAAAAARRRRV